MYAFTKTRLTIVIALLTTPSVLMARPTPTQIPVLSNGKIAFQSERDGNREIYIMAPDGSNQTRLTFVRHLLRSFPIDECRRYGPNPTYL